MTAKKLAPPTVAKPNIAPSSFTMTVIVPHAKTPYTTEGTAANSSTIEVIIVASFLGAILQINKALKTANGNAISNAAKLEIKVLMIINPTP
ncbi:unknown [Amedibacillus dolichus CAG:375]|uniref:Uncharacterized protein n=1 Tax=Amedibacillus dolichus CAG:375 TaxID=1263076 RepID=R7G781_9FIRM|nr:unknown [Amedibacillus dolichus CAG:375]